MAGERGGGPGSSPPGGAADLQLLVVVGAPRSTGLLELLLRRIEAGVRCWSVDVDILDQQLKLFVSRHSAFLSEEVRGQRTLRYHGDVLDTQVLVNPMHDCVCSEVRRFILGSAPQKLLILAGRCLELSGDLELQDGFFSASDLVQILTDEAPPPCCLTVCCPNSGSWLDVAWSGLGGGTVELRINPPPVLFQMEGLQEFTEYLSESLEPESPFEVLEPPGTAGFLKLSRPCCYLFPGGRGHSAFFAVNGFNILVDGGAGTRSCFWKLVRHLDRIDAVLVTHVGIGSLPGLNGLLLRKAAEQEAEVAGEDCARKLISPEIGVVFLNTPDGLKTIEEDPGELRGRDQAALALRLLERLAIKPRLLCRTVEPATLFHKMGVGRLEMYTLNPPSKDLEVLTTGSDLDLVSVCILLVWHPASLQDKIVRVLFPGCTSQDKILDGLEKLKHLEFLKHPAPCTQDPEGSGTGSRESFKPKESKPSGADKKPETKTKAKEIDRTKLLKVIPKKEIAAVKPKKVLKPDLKKDSKPDLKTSAKPAPKEVKRAASTSSSVASAAGTDVRKPEAKIPPKRVALPKGGVALPKGGVALPKGGVALPKGGVALPKGGVALLMEGTKAKAPPNNQDDQKPPQIANDDNGNQMACDLLSASSVASLRPNGHFGVHGVVDIPQDVDLCLVTPCEFRHLNTAETGQSELGANDNTTRCRTPDPSGGNPPSTNSDFLPTATDSDVPPSTEDFPSTSAELDSDSGDEEASDLVSPSYAPLGPQLVSLDLPPAPVKDLPPLPLQPGTCMVDPDADGKKSKKPKKSGGSGVTLNGKAKSGNFLKQPARSAQAGSKSSAKASPGLNLSGTNGPAVYVDLAYLPSGAASSTVDANLFRRLRSSHYVVSGDDPAKDVSLHRVLDALLEGKSLWPDLPVTLIPTFDSRAMHEWYQETVERQVALSLTVLGSNSTVAMQDESFPACKVEF